MVTFGAIRRLAVFVSVIQGAAGCVSSLDDLQGTSGEDTEEGMSDVVVPSPTSVSDVGAPSSEPMMDSGADTQAPPVPTPPPCTDGVLNEDGFCVPSVRCAPGTFVSEVGGSRVCSPCASGQFSNTYDAAECQSWRDCSVGDYVVEAATATADRVCEKCPDGETTVSENSGECTGADDCAAGTYETEDECVPCAAGNYCSGKTQSEVPCESGTWDEDSDAATPCVVKTTCAAGQFVSDEGTTLSDRSCDFCEEATFATENNAPRCEQWSSCDAGSYVGLQGTSTSDRQCEPCPSGTFSSEGNLALCETWTTCEAPSEYSAEAPTLAQDRSCSDCPAGFMAGEDNAEACEVPIPPNLVTNYDFETNTTGWVSWIGTVSVSTASAHTGSRSLLVAGPSTGPAATNLDAVVEAGASYDVSFWVNVGRVSEAQVNLTRSLTCNGNVTYLWVANNPSVVSGVWTELSGTFSVSASCGSPKLQVYAEGAGANVDLYVDNVRITKVP